MLQNERRKVQMMFQEGYFNMTIIEELKTKVIELQYYNNELSMFILLPEDDCEDSTGLEQVTLVFSLVTNTESSTLALLQCGQKTSGKSWTSFPCIHYGANHYSQYHLTAWMCPHLWKTHRMDQLGCNATTESEGVPAPVQDGGKLCSQQHSPGDGSNECFCLGKSWFVRNLYERWLGCIQGHPEDNCGSQWRGHWSRLFHGASCNASVLPSNLWVQGWPSIPLLHQTQPN